MRARTYQHAQKIAIELAIPLHPFLMSSFEADGYESGNSNHFDFTISRESLLDPDDIVMGDMIGEGSNSIVYRGLYQTLVPVAVKVMQPSRTAAVSIQHKEKFQKEVMYLSRIKHDSIVKFIGACIEPQLMIVTELLEGGTLQNLLWNSRPNTLDLRMSLSYALDISRAMELLHSKGLIHRDLKPKNVLVTRDMAHVKLADFGLVREETTGGMTIEAGTYRWMAPEVCGPDLRKGDKLHYDHKADVYSFAIVLWELITNKQPFPGIPQVVVPYQVRKNNMRPSLMDIPGELVSIIASCWAADSNARPEFKEITITLTNLLRAVCINSTYESIEESASRVNSNSSIVQTVRNYPIANEEDDHDDTDAGPTTNLIQGSNCQEMEPKKQKGDKSKKVMKLISPLFKMFRACLYKP